MSGKSLLQPTCQGSPSVNKSNQSRGHQLEDSSQVKDHTTNYQRPAAADPVSGEVAEDDTKEAAGLKSADNVGLEGSKLGSASIGQLEAAREGRERHGSANEGAVVTKHGTAHGR